MFSKKFLNISEFARISGVSRQTLIYYDRIGLFSPAYAARNGYRMYSHKQVDTMGIVTILSDLGVPLKKIKEILADISVETTEKTLNYQLAEIEKKIEKLSALKDMTKIRLEQIEEGKRFLNGGSSEFHVEEVVDDIPVRVGDEVNLGQEGIDDETIVAFFEKVEKIDLPVIFSFGFIKRSADVLRGRYDAVSRLWFRLRDEKYADAFIPAGEYLVGYAEGDYGDSDDAYEKMMDFARKNGLTVAGDVYEEFLIDELCEKNPNKFVSKIFVEVK